jgi:hypothetical protein
MIPWGSVVGGTIGGIGGFLVGGPAGAFIGASAGAGLGGGVDSASATEKATNAQLAAADQAKKEYLKYNQPYYDVGTQNMKTLNQMVNSGAYTPNMQGWETDPGYQFRLQQGLGSINAGAAAGGSRFSGATLKALQKYGQDYASNEYQNIYNRKANELSNQYTRQAGLAQMGYNAASGLGDVLSENAYQNGNAQSAGIIGQQNAYNNMFSNLGQIGMMGAMMGGGPSRGMGIFGQGGGGNVPQTAKSIFEQNYGSALREAGL